MLVAPILFTVISTTPKWLMLAKIAAVGVNVALATNNYKKSRKGK